MRRLPPSSGRRTLGSSHRSHASPRTRNTNSQTIQLLRSSCTRHSPPQPQHHSHGHHHPQQQHQSSQQQRQQHPQQQRQQLPRAPPPSSGSSSVGSFESMCDSLRPYLKMQNLFVRDINKVGTLAAAGGGRCNSARCASCSHHCCLPNGQQDVPPPIVKAYLDKLCPLGKVRTEGRPSQQQQQQRRRRCSCRAAAAAGTACCLGCRAAGGKSCAIAAAPAAPQTQQHSRRRQALICHCLRGLGCCCMRAPQVVLPIDHRDQNSHISQAYLNYNSHDECERQGRRANGGSSIARSCRPSCIMHGAELLA